ncbi:hypothetical protein KC343_g1176 [Hortaea werneckii]|uniref:X-Pro dipeptidyl-peptidase n=1 Tax=Hortaea werneckii TaxID=91943 RepID=A0A3M7HAS5_HORWE|nr:hypothetical protein KC352_g21614 [Hortaea werneckii]KAI7573045.1 hypothetical protein KC317_g224 [Hortaea werneckii]KAI7628381.1 hypothetical protein KC346_g203 [Hortaea werneckii]KAI7636625.1 hypothetical protein KC343_g1176 [Hortaea werneckii]KAI7683232.1 hypothetical protein KC319_g571 [Hortaea werneckii]
MTRNAVSGTASKDHARSDLTQTVPILDIDISQLITTIREDVKDITSFYECSYSRTRLMRLRAYLESTRTELTSVCYSHLDQEGQVDYILLEKHLDRQLEALDTTQERNAELEFLLEPFAMTLVELVEERQRVAPTAGQRAAGILSTACQDIEAKQAAAKSGHLRCDSEKERLAVFRALGILHELRRLFEEWIGFYQGYDPEFTWWVVAPCKQLLHLLPQLARSFKEDLLGIGNGEKDAIVGQPAGREAILKDLDEQFIAYTPEELVCIAEKEYSWCEAEMVKASNDLGYSQDWKAALEHVKNLYVRPGQQTHLVRELAEEAIDYVKKHDMVTIPDVAAEFWKTEMMSPERQKENPFFLGGERIIVSYPTDTMSHEDKLMSMRGNSRPFSRSTVFHELVPGHHLQYHMIKRYRSYRSVFSTPFWMEGWAFYWEFILWDLGFAGTPEDKIGMLFWRMHRCARIIFSLKFHLGEMTARECVEYLVAKVGHERATAEGEVRRSFSGSYSPLYQAGYMLGALQFYALREEIVHTGGMTEKKFHDRILKEGEMPIELLRSLLHESPLKPDHRASWRFYDL